jgi:hypothetical protein
MTMRAPQVDLGGVNRGQKLGQIGWKLALPYRTLFLVCQSPAKLRQAGDQSKNIMRG